MGLSYPWFFAFGLLTTILSKEIVPLGEEFLLILGFLLFFSVAYNSLADLVASTFQAQQDTVLSAFTKNLVSHQNTLAATAVNYGLLVSLFDGWTLATKTKVEDDHFFVDHFIFSTLMLWEMFSRGLFTGMNTRVDFV